jgi:hypothetical protein
MGNTILGTAISPITGWSIGFFENVGGTFIRPLIIAAAVVMKFILGTRPL